MSDTINKNNGLPQNIFSNTMADMKWTDIKRYADENAIVLLPMGVIEEHGPHNCLATDIYTAHIYCIAVQKIFEKEDTRLLSRRLFIGVSAKRQEVLSAHSIFALTPRKPCYSTFFRH
jgi:creatinine amidohydrolase